MRGQLDRLVRLHRGRVRRQVGRRQGASLARGGAAGARPLDAHVREVEHARETEGAGLVGDCADVSTRTRQARLREERRRHDDHVVGERLTSGASRVGSRPARGRAAAEDQGAEQGDVLRVHESLDAGRPSSGSRHRARRGPGSRGTW